MKKGNAIFMCINASFLEIAKICLLSLKDNCKNYPEIIIHTTDLSENNKNELNEIISGIYFIENKLTEDLIGPIMDHLPSTLDARVFYSRFLLWEASIFDTYENILYLDADCLVLSDISNLLNNNEFICIKESYTGEDKIFRFNKDNELLSKLIEDDIKIDDLAWNGGVFLLPSKYRNKKYLEEIKMLLYVYKKYIKWADQSLLNIWTYKNKIDISHNYNLNYQHRLLFDDNEIQKNIKIMHFNGVPQGAKLLCMKIFYQLYKEGKIDEYKSFYSGLNSNEK